MISSADANIAAKTSSMLHRLTPRVQRLTPKRTPSAALTTRTLAKPPRTLEYNITVHGLDPSLSIPPLLFRVSPLNQCREPRERRFSEHTALDMREDRRGEVVLKT